MMLLVYQIGSFAVSFLVLQVMIFGLINVESLANTVRDQLDKVLK